MLSLHFPRSVEMRISLRLRVLVDLLLVALLSLEVVLGLLGMLRYLMVILMGCSIPLILMG